MSYEVYKIIHITFIVLAFCGLAVQLYAGVNDKMFKIINGVAALLILVSGMGLLARIGINHGEPWAAWIKLKFVVWGVIAIGAPVVGKRFQKFSKPYFWITVATLVVAVGLVNYKP